MRINFRGRMIPLERFNYKIPSKEIRTPYEDMKYKFVQKLSMEFVVAVDEKERELEMKMSRDDLSDVEREVFSDVIEQGLTPLECAAKRQKSPRTIYDTLKRIKRKGFAIEKWIKYRNAKGKQKIDKEKRAIEISKQPIPPFN